MAPISKSTTDTKGKGKSSTSASTRHSTVATSPHKTPGWDSAGEDVADERLGLDEEDDDVASDYMSADEDVVIDPSAFTASSSSHQASSSSNASPGKNRSPAPPRGDDGDAKMELDPSMRPNFAPLTAKQIEEARTKGAGAGGSKAQVRKVAIPPHRMTPLKRDWIKIYGPLVEMTGLQVRMNVMKRAVEIRSSKHTEDVGALQKGADFVKAYALGFEADDAIALLRMDDLFIDTFEIKDVKTLHGDHLSRAIGRIAGQGGKTRFAIENASRTRIVLADTKIHILGSFQNIKIARDAIVSLILGSPPGKVYAGLKTVAARQRQRF